MASTRWSLNFTGSSKIFPLLSLFHEYVCSSFIKFADDFLMMKECVLRRLNQLKNLAPEKRPQLFLIDGGKGQLNFAAQAIKEAGFNIQVISLAKKEEEIFLPNRSNSLRLPKNSPALRLLQEIRDEVHRFVITYHRLLRNKALYK